MLQCESALQLSDALLAPQTSTLLQCVAECCSVLQCVAVCVSLCCSALQCVAVRRSASQCVAVCCSVCPRVLQFVAVCCSVLQWEAALQLSDALLPQIK